MFPENRPQPSPLGGVRVHSCWLTDTLDSARRASSDWLLRKLVPQKGCPEVRDRVAGRCRRECSLFSSFACISFGVLIAGRTFVHSLYTLLEFIPFPHFVFRSSFMRAFISHCCWAETIVWLSCIKVLPWIRADERCANSYSFFKLNFNIIYLIEKIIKSYH